MNTTYHFLIARDSLDGMRYALPTFPTESKRRLLLIPRDAVRAPLFLGHFCPPDYVGLSGLFQYDAEQLAVRRTDQNEPVHIVFSSHLEAQMPFAALLDRLRTRLSNWTSVSVVLTYTHALEDLPPLVRQDAATFLWDLRQPPTDPELDRLQAIRQRLSAAHAKFHGVHLTCPASMPAEEIKSHLDQIRPHSPGPLREPVRL